MAVPEPEPVVATATEAESVLAVEEPVSPPVEPTLEEVEIAVWWPKDTGPFRHRPETTAHHRPKPKDQKERPQKHDRKQANERNERREEPKRRPEKPLDPNSPFAVLGALKAQMMGNKN